MKKVLVFLILSLGTSTLWAQDWMKADWYSTKKQIMAKEGKPLSDFHDSLGYSWKIAGITTPVYYEIEDSMLQSVTVAAHTMVFKQVMEDILNHYGKPSYRNSKDKTFAWKTDKSWILLNAVGDSNVLLELFPLDTDNLTIDRIVHPLSIDSN